MNRCVFLSTLLNNKTSSPNLSTATPPPSAPRPKPSSTILSIAPYTGTWGFEQAAHLLRRTTFGATYAQMQTALTDGLNTTVSQLLMPVPYPSYHPVIHELILEDGTTSPLYGDTWHNKSANDFDNDVALTSLGGWLMSQLILSTNTLGIHQKMMLFWQSHFAVSVEAVDSAHLLYQYMELLRTHALGNFKQLVKDVTINPAMLEFLNGNQNTSDSPNENYARELLELYTVGKGDLAAPGDYTTFTEQDVEAIAKVLTGWYDMYYDNGMYIGPAVFDIDDHDTSTKQLSHHFNNASITNNGNQEYSDLIDVIFNEQPQTVARYICTKLYLWFVNYRIDIAIEQNVIYPLADILINNNFNVLPVLETLLKSEHFYDVCHVGSMIKNPIDYVANISRQFEFQFPATPTEDLEEQYHAWMATYWWSYSIQMGYLEPPNVAGWKAYYQAPHFYRLWINGTTLKVRLQIAGNFLYGSDSAFGDQRTIDYLAFLGKINNPSDPNSVVDEFTKILHPFELTANQKTYLKNILIPGLPDFEWTVEYNNYINNPTDPNITMNVSNKVRGLILNIVLMPEFQLM